jgi:hypothetical protein
VSDATPHLTEAERHALAADVSSAASDGAPSVHVRECASCGEDVDRIRALMSAARGLPDDVVPDDLWPSIRSRIEASKVVTMASDPARAAHRAGHTLRRRAGAFAALASLGAAALILGAIDNRAPRPWAPDAVHGTSGLRTPASMVADSARFYEEESRQLLDRLELQRALLRPEAARALDEDLRTIDAAIVELKDAIAHDPDNPALRQLLASSYRQKVELLKRAGNAG